MELFASTASQKNHSNAEWVETIWGEGTGYAHIYMYIYMYIYVCIYIIVCMLLVITVDFGIAAIMTIVTNHNNSCNLYQCGISSLKDA